MSSTAQPATADTTAPARPRLPSHLARLEAESIGILRETAAVFANPLLMYSVGKDSSVLVHLARKAFFPGPVPFKLLHVDTTWKFREMISFRDRLVADYGLDLVVHSNQEGIAAKLDPQRDPVGYYTDMMKTRALRQALDMLKTDAAIGGARRDEERSRAKERIFSVRSRGHRWDPKAQRPEPWGVANTRLSPGETMRVFPLSNWTERDVWAYIQHERIPVVPLYFAAPRPVVQRAGTWIMADDERLVLQPGEQIETRTVRFRTLGCYPLTGAIESTATDLDAVIHELETTRWSERQGRLIDGERADSMERKKSEGYF
ncbi:sulfate adenylyltransferase subunit CysD [Lacibacterium aquatile]|uniref:Sulfate adenylyltransferase subunit 2 n=1 Tax=Lacibacterium aquatile TaxID=1168082 RepID=A0ABW5DWP7_9PROT